MMRWVVLLRAVNVGGTAKLPMEALREAVLAHGFKTVSTYLASGNMILDSELDADAVRLAMDGILNAAFHISGSRSIVRDAPVFQRILRSNPFREAALQRPEMLHVHFLASPPHDTAEMNLTSYKGVERLRLDGQHLYIDYPQGAGQSALTGRFLETALGTTGTSRNWNTVLKLTEMLGQE
jgi:uncharacterized protein (DUF1697 family)